MAAFTSAAVFGSSRLDPLSAALLGIGLVMPSALVLGLFVSPWILLLPPLIAFLEVTSLYLQGGFIFIRLPASVLAVGLSAASLSAFAKRLGAWQA